MAEPTIPAAVPDIEINYQNKMEINTGDADTPEWVDLGVCMENLAPVMNEVVHQSSMYADKGWGRSDVTGGQIVITMTGKKMPGDPASDYICDLERRYGFGAKRKTHLRITSGEDVVIWGVTLAKINANMGASTDQNSLTVEAHTNGAPSIGKKA